MIKSRKARKVIHRTLHLIDAENLCGGPDASPAAVAYWAERYAAAVGIGAGDQTVVATSHWAAPRMAFAWPAGRRLWRSGPDGADLALIEVMSDESVARRFDRVVIGSGDGGFAPSAASLAAQGCEVVAVYAEGRIGSELYLATHRAVDLRSTASMAVDLGGVA